MRKERVVLVIVVSLILILSVSLVSASILGDFGNWFNKVFNGKITGNAVSIGFVNSLGSIDTTKWSQVNPNNPAFIENGRLKCSGSTGGIGSSASGVSGSGKWKLHGDFDIQVDYDSSLLTTNNYYPTVALQVTDSNYNYVMYVDAILSGSASTIYRLNAWSEQSSWNKGGTTSTNTNGKFRIQRTGNTINGYYWIGNAWTLYVTSSGQDTSDMLVTIKAYNDVSEGTNSQGVVPYGYFNNFTMNSGNVINQANPCTPNCAGKACGDDSCNGTCGSCSSGFTCTNGYCTNSNPTQNCNDSDGGMNYYVRGTFSGMWNGTYVSNTDSCLSFLNDSGDDVTTSNYLGEGYCQNNQLMITKITCPNGCSNGACINSSYHPNETCTDSDSGLSYYTKGNVTKTMTTGIAISFDSCIDNNILEEVYCEGTGVKSIRYTCPYGCSNAACIESNITPGRYCCDRTKTGALCQMITDISLCAGQTSQTNCEDTSFCKSSCTDSDNGANKYVRGTACLNSECKNDTCQTQNEDSYVIENYCSDNSYISDKYMHCENGCINGACSKTIPVQNSVCQDLINKAANPEDISIYDLNYSASDWNYNNRGDMYISGADYKYTQYSGNWNTYVNSGNQDNSYDSTNINIDLYVFDDKTVNLTSFTNDLLNANICEIQSYWGSDDTENVVYICNWDILNNRASLDNYDSKYRQVVWIKSNVIVEFDIQNGRSLTDAEINKIAQNKFNDFIESLKNNQQKYISSDNFEIPYIAGTFLRTILKDCSSDLTRPLVPGTNDSCNPNWECKVEPIICPEHGTQTKTCIDYGCNLPKRTEQIYCSPGICSGCYVPRWFGYDNGDNVCIPYGTRLPALSNSQKNTIIEKNTTGENEDYILNIIDSNSAYLKLQYGDETVYDSNIYSRSSYTIDLTKFGGKVIQINVDNIVPAANGQSGYVEIEVSSNFNAYCNYDGTIQEQKSVDYQGNWAKCQNNYECESNICSSGECYEVSRMLQEAKGYKATFIKIFCGLSSVFGIEDLENCLTTRLGLPTPSTNSAQPSGGAGGGGASSSSK